MSLDRLLPLDSAAEALQLAPSTLRRWRRKGRIRAHVLSTAMWSDVIDFSGAQPATYFCPSEVLQDADRLAAHLGRPSVLVELLEAALIRHREVPS